MANMIREIKHVQASSVRTMLGELTRPDPSTVYVIMRRGRPLMLIWPAGDLTDDGALNTRIAQAVKARNAIPGEKQIAVPDSVKEITQTELRRKATAFYLDISGKPAPGVITHYGQRAALFVPISASNGVSQWVTAMNRLLN